MRQRSTARRGGPASAAVVALFVMFAWIGCGGDEVAEPCSAANCPDGCCLAGQCSPGVTSAACGTGGLLCQVCATGQSCSNGVCGGGDFGCSHLNCRGGCCTESGLCITPPTDLQCGTGGAKCDACTPDKTCTLGQCTAKQAGCDGCQGCCHEDTCMLGNTSAACGAGGGACQSCGADEVCDDGGCLTPPEPCDASNCGGGCCTGEGACLPYDKQDLPFCGKGGDPCTVCPPAALQCEQGTCVETQACASFCGAGCCDAQDQCISHQQQDSIGCGTAGALCEPCAGGTSCVAGQCVGGAVWEIWAMSATIAVKKPDGSDWDNSWVSNPNPDPFFGIAPAAVKWLWQFDDSSVQDNTFGPQWNEKVGAWEEAALLDPNGVLFHVVDDDAGVGNFNDDIGVCTVVLTASILQAGTYNTTCGSATSLTVKFVKQ